jgi:hypothetical protein
LNLAGSSAFSKESNSRRSQVSVGPRRFVLERTRSTSPSPSGVVCRNQEAIELMIAVYPHMGARRQAKIREVLAQVEKRPA